MLLSELLLIGALFGAAAPGGLQASSDTLQPPGEGPGPTEVSLAFYVVDILEIEDAEETFKADIAYNLRWHDPRLARPGGDTVQRPMSEVWNPRVTVVNQAGIKNAWPDVVEVDAEGNVFYRQRLLGHFSSSFELRDFPGDVQDLRVDFATVGYGPDEVMLVADTARSGLLEGAGVAGWELELGEGEAMTARVPGQSEALAMLGWHLYAARNANYYRIKIFLTVALIVFMAWTVFWIDPTQAGPQIGVSTASVFSLIAYGFSLSRELPRVSYLTRADHLMLGSTLLVFGALAEAVWTARLAAKDRLDEAQRIDRVFRIVYPIVFAGLLLTYG